MAKSGENQRQISAWILDFIMIYYLYCGSGRDAQSTA